MVWLKKLSADWNPSENRNLQVGEIIEFHAPYEDLVRNGMALLVDETGSELELPGQVLSCPICFADSEGITAFIEHVSEHAQKRQENIKAQIEEASEKIEEAKKDVIAIAEAEEKAKAVEEPKEVKETKKKK